MPLAGAQAEPVHAPLEWLKYDAARVQAAKLGRAEALQIHEFVLYRIQAMLIT
jgi:hypothetical protein